MDVKLLRLTTGEDIVAEMVYSDASITTIKKPFVLIPMAQNPGSNAETKLYFSPFIPFAENEEMSIKEENINKPLSDNEISKFFTTKGVSVARRTITKYREKINIPNSTQRKRNTYD